MLGALGCFGLSTTKEQQDEARAKMAGKRARKPHPDWMKEVPGSDWKPTIDLGQDRPIN